MIRKSISPNRLRQVRRAFESGMTTVPLLARSLGISPTTFRKLTREQGWSRKAATVTSSRLPDAEQTAQSARPDDSVAAGDSDEAGFDTEALARSVKETIERKIAIVGTALTQPGAKLVERDARFFTSLVKALVELRRLENGQASPRRKGGHERAERPPRDMAALRADLVAKLERLQAAGSGR